MFPKMRRVVVKGMTVGPGERKGMQHIKTGL